MARSAFILRVLPLMVALIGAYPVAAGESPATSPALEALNRETTALYRKVQTGVYRVQLPQPKWVNAYAMAGVKRLDKQLDPELRKRLEQDPAAATGTADGTSLSSPGDATTIVGQGTYIVVHQQATPRDPVLGGKLEFPPGGDPTFIPTHIGLLIDDHGHVVVPIYVEREAIANGAVRISGPDGVLAEAKFVGSDRPTNLTLLYVEKPAGTPVLLGARRPEAGSLVMCLSGCDGSGRLGMWTESPQENGIILTTDGQIAGIARYGQFLSGSACRLIAQQLIEHGSVKRAILGVLVTEVRQDDPLHRPQQVIAARPAMRIDQVIANSAADRAGLKPGDLVTAIAGQPVGDLPTFATAIAARTGSTELEILREGKVLKISVELQQEP